MTKPNGPYALAIRLSSVEEINRGLERMNDNLRERLALLEEQIRALNCVCDRQGDTIIGLHRDNNDLRLAYALAEKRATEAKARLKRLDVGLGARA